MKSVYISSPYEDLKDYRQAVADALRSCGYSVEAMEKYPARDNRPRVVCETDAANSDLYVGILAWRYGYIPIEDNPEGQSITELEYLAAGRAEKPRLIFLLADDVPWPATLRDAKHEKDNGKRIRELRTRLKSEKWVAFFRDPDNLAKRALVSVLQYKSTKRVEKFGGDRTDQHRHRVRSLLSPEHPTADRAIGFGPSLWPYAFSLRPGGTRGCTSPPHWRPTLPRSASFCCWIWTVGSFSWRHPLKSDAHSPRPSQSWKWCISRAGNSRVANMVVK